VGARLAGGQGNDMSEGRTMAIGVVHGCSAALAALVRAIAPGRSIPLFPGRLHRPGAGQQKACWNK
jgi:hypothetical protein